ncbi:Uncharacterised protein [Streptococcus pneumoniae]|nr:Uncharacterised protein [Streptococcus pneumoniae]VTJ18177.1 Uncharacterised protein [Streptococcus pneumoniae]
MNELDISNTQAVFVTVILIGLLLYLNHRDRKKALILSEKAETPSEDLNPDYGRYIQLAGVDVWGGIERV